MLRRRDRSSDMAVRCRPAENRTSPRALMAVLLPFIALALAGCPAPAKRTDRRRQVEEILRDHEPKARDGPATAVTRALPEVRIRLSRPSKAGRAKIAIRGAYQFIDSNGRAARQGSALSGDLVLGTEASIAGFRVPEDGVVVDPATEGDLRIGDRVYPGVLYVERGADGSFQATIATDLETYVAGVVPGELPASFHAEAQRTQAIIARTYTLSSSAAGSSSGAGLSAAPIHMADHGGADQEYVGIPTVDTHRAVAAQAAQSTRGMVLMNVSAPLRTYYHSTCGGHTSPVQSVFPDAPIVPLSGVPCAWCTASKYYRWSAEIPALDCVRAAGLTGELLAVTVAARDRAERATTLRVKTTKGTRDVAAGQFRLRAGPSKLRSVHLDELRVADGALHVAGRGWGHGVGLCQMGAKGLAERGLKAEDILTTYYPGARLVRLW